jgi:CHAD domain-containing protein
VPRKSQLADPSTRLLKEKIARLYRRIPRALAGEEEPLHQMRVAARRLRVALPLLARKPAGKRVRRARRVLRDLTRGGGRSRDLDVIKALYEEHAGTAAGVERRSLLRGLRDARSRARRQLGGELLDVDIARLRRDLDAILARRGEPVFGVFGRLREAIEAERARVVEGLQAIGEEFQPQALHRVRIRFRRLRYTAEVVDALRGRESEAPQLFRQVQEAVGLLHDAWVLASWLEQRGGRARARGQAELARVAEEDRELFLRRAEAQHRDFLALGPLALLTRGVEAMLAPRSAA